MNDPVLAKLMKASRRTRGETAAVNLSRQIAARLGPEIERLGLQWQVDPGSPKRRPSLYAIPAEGTYQEEHAQFAEAVAALTDGHVKTSADEYGTVAFFAFARLSGVDVRIATLIWGYDNPSEYTLTQRYPPQTSSKTPGQHND